ncbi:hypothetical protein CFBP4215_02125 [Pseudomonas syringae pv. syringae]|nr:hypothetical protein CFBP4215_02125 [Pseudomonas syringae pv. syringae]
MPFTRTRITAVSILASLVLSGCATQPQETWTNQGPSKIVTENGRYVCYTDAQIIDGTRTRFNLCATPSSGLISANGPQIWVGAGYRRPFKYPLSEAINGAVVPLEDLDNVQLKCESLKKVAGSSTPETFCKVTLKDKVLVSAQIVFEGM